MENTSKVMEAVLKVGYKPKERRAIVVKYQGDNVVESVVKTVFPSFYVLQICEDEILLLPFSNWDQMLKAKVHIAIPYKDIVNIDVESSMLNYNIEIKTKDEDIKLNTQKSELSGLRLSGLLACINDSFFGNRNWHGEDLDDTLEELKAII